jgi:hypothetical protein
MYKLKKVETTQCSPFHLSKDHQTKSNYFGPYINKVNYASNGLPQGRTGNSHFCLGTEITYTTPRNWYATDRWLQHGQPGTTRKKLIGPKLPPGAPIIGAPVLLKYTVSAPKNWHVGGKGRAGTNRQRATATQPPNRLFSFEKNKRK